MASKRVEKVVHQRQHSTPSIGTAQQVQIIEPNPDESQKSLDELFKVGKINWEKEKERERAGNFTKKMNNRKMPSSFSQKPTIITKTRNWSAGHSREGSSDDGISSGGTNRTLSPASVGSIPGQYSSSVVHVRHESAPELIYNDPIIQQQQQQQQQQNQLHQHSRQQLAAPLHKTAKSWDAKAPASHQLQIDAYPSPESNYFVDSSKGWSSSKSQSLGHLHSSPLAPLPTGWAMEYNADGEAYFIDHNSKTTSWYDPRLPKEIQEQHILERHSLQQMAYPHPSGQMEYTAQQAPFSPQTQTNQRVQQLQQERSSLQQRQQQLMREGLLDPRSPQQYQNVASPISPIHPQNMAGPADPFLCHYGQQSAANEMLLSSFEHHRDISNDSAVETTDMDIEYVAAQHHQQQGQMPFDPTAVIMADAIDPQEFDKYLSINSTPTTSIYNR